MAVLTGVVCLHLSGCLALLAGRRAVVAGERSPAWLPALLASSHVSLSASSSIVRPGCSSCLASSCWPASPSTTSPGPAPSPGPGHSAAAVSLSDEARTEENGRLHAVLHDRKTSRVSGLTSPLRCKAWR